MKHHLLFIQILNLRLKYKWCKDNLEKSSTTKNDEHILCKYSMYVEDKDDIY